MTLGAGRPKGHALHTTAVTISANEAYALAMRGLRKLGLGDDYARIIAVSAPVEYSPSFAG